MNEGKEYTCNNWKLICEKAALIIWLGCPKKKSTYWRLVPKQTAEIHLFTDLGRTVGQALTCW